MNSIAGHQLYVILVKLVLTYLSTIYSSIKVDFVFFHIAKDKQYTPSYLEVKIWQTHFNLLYL